MVLAFVVVVVVVLVLVVLVVVVVVIVVVVVVVFPEFELLFVLGYWVVSTKRGTKMMMIFFLRMGFQRMQGLTNQRTLLLFYFGTS